MACFRGTCVHSRSVYTLESVEYAHGGVWMALLEKDLVFSSQWHVSEAHVYTLGVWNMMEGGWLFREGFSV